jgi:hypothetical protein
MTTCLAPDRAPTDTGGEDDDLHHIWCCDPDVAVCGVDLTGVPDAGDVGDGVQVCPLCALAWDGGLPCPVPGCRQ